METENDFIEEKSLVDSFISIKKIPLNLSFVDLNYTTEIYVNNPLFEHVINHLKNEVATKLKPINEETDITKNRELLKKIGGFIARNNITNSIVEEILNNGIPNNIPCLRPMIWKAFIGYYPSSTLDKWKEITLYHYNYYNQLKKKYPLDVISLVNTKENEENQKLILQIDKDLPRTRSDMNFFKEINKFNPQSNETNYDIIRRVLFIYSKSHNSIMYVQGMNEICALIYYIFAIDDNKFMYPFIESEIYFCFEIFMDEIKPIFMMKDISYSQLFISQQIKKIKKIMKVIMPEVLEHLKNIDIELDLCVTRWLFCLFSQEFNIDMAVNFMDRLLTQDKKMDFLCFFTVAIWKAHKEKILNYEMEEVMKWSQTICSKFDSLDLNFYVKEAINIKKTFEFNKEWENV